MSVEDAVFAVDVDFTKREIWFMGGERSTSSSFKYSIDDNAFDSLPSLQHNIQTGGNGGSVTVNGVLYFNSWNEYEIDSFDTQTGQWQYPLSPALPNKRIVACLATDGRFVYVIGGWWSRSTDPAVVAVNDTQIYDTLMNEWLTDIAHNRLNEVRGDAVCKYYDGYIYAFNGRQGHYEYLNSIEKLYVGTDTNNVRNVLGAGSSQWQLLQATLPFSRWGFAAVQCQDVDQHLIYIIGGYTGEGQRILSDVEIFDTSDDTVIHAPFALNMARFKPAGACIGAHIYVFGGGTRIDPPEFTSTWEVSNALFVTTDNPTTNEPTTPEPTTEAPTSKQPTTFDPTTTNPTTHAPTTKQPTTNDPTTSEPTTQGPTTHEPTTHEPSTKMTSFADDNDADDESDEDEDESEVSEDTITTTTSEIGESRASTRSLSSSVIVVIACLVGGCLCICGVWCVGLRWYLSEKEKQNVSTRNVKELEVEERDSSVRKASDVEHPSVDLARQTARPMELQEPEGQESGNAAARGTETRRGSYIMEEDEYEFEIVDDDDDEDENQTIQ